MIKKLMKMIAVALVAVVAALVIAVPAHAAEPYTVSDIYLYDLDGSESTLSERYGGTRRIVIVGRSTCGNTRNAVNQALSLSITGAYDSVNFLVLDCDGDSEAFAEGFGEMETDRVRFYSSDDRRYNSWAWNNVSNISGTITLPYIVVIDENDQVVYGSTGPQTLATICQECFGIEPGIANLMLYDLDGTKTSMEERYDRTKRVVIVGRDTCTNTQNVAKNAVKLSQKDEYADINFLVLDYDGDREGFTSVYGPMETDRVHFYSDGTDAYNSWAWDMYYGSGQSGSVSLPFIVLIDENNHVLSVTAGPQSLSTLCSTYFGIENQGLATADVRGYASTEAGMELLDLVNEARAAVGVDPLVWDADLAQTAIQRAAEVAAFYSHTRPDGTDCFTAWPSWSMAAAENIAAYQSTVEEVNTSWTNSTGHYKNMINGDMVSFAAAMFRNDNGFCFWVECFSGDIGPNGQGQATAGEVTCTIHFDTEIVNLSFSNATSISTTYGYSRQLGMPTLGNANLVSTSLTWGSSNPSVATVSSDGNVTTVGVGSTEITAAITDNPKVCASVAFTVNARSISYASVYLDKYSYTYTGDAITPGVRVTLSGNSLVEGIDYTVSYSDNIEIGTATVTITGMGNYKDTTTATFSIIEKSKIDISKATISVDDQTYAGSALTPAVTVTLDGTKLVQGQDYSLKYENNVNVGTAKVIVTGDGDYTGTATKTFAIMRISLLNATITVSDTTYTGEIAKPVVTVVLNGKQLVEGQDYSVSVYDYEVGLATAYIEGQGVYRDRIGKTFRIKPIDITAATITVDDVTYTGSALTPEVTVTLNGEELYEDWDYSVEYSNNINVGKATVKIKGLDTYAGEITKTFTIKPASLAGATVIVDDQTYTGSAVTPAVTVKLNGKPLVKDTDYTVAYTNNINVGTATVTVTGKGNYEKTASATFEITQTAPQIKTGWQQIDGWWYFLDNDGKPMCDHWEQYQGKWYYFNEDDGALVWTGVCKYQGKYYYVKSGTVQTTKSGWKQVGSDWYYFNGAYGAAYQNQWYVYKTSYYYLKGDGKLAISEWVTYQGTRYHFNASGVCDRVG